MADSPGWDDDLRCPMCGCLDVGILAEPRAIEGIRGGLRVLGAWVLPGRACCRNERCRCEFEYTYIDEPDEAIG